MSKRIKAPSQFTHDPRDMPWVSDCEIEMEGMLILYHSTFSCFVLFCRHEMFSLVTSFLFCFLIWDGRSLLITLVHSKDDARLHFFATAPRPLDFLDE